MACSRRKDKTIAHRDFERLAGRTAYQERGVAAPDPEHLMSAGVMVLIIENAVAPDAGPSVPCEGMFEIGRPAIQHGGSIDQNWKPLVIRYPVALWEKHFLDIHL